jgi:hypothetical protein
VKRTRRPGDLALLVTSLLMPRPASGICFGLVVIAIGLISGDSGIRFVVPVGVAVFAYWLASDERVYTSFYATTAQVVPVLILAAVIEQRDVLRDAARGQGTLLLFGLTLMYMLFAECGSVYAVATCPPDGTCAPEGVRLSDAVRVALEDAGLSGLVVGGVGGGIASLVVAALLPRRMPPQG